MDFRTALAAHRRRDFEAAEAGYLALPSSAAAQHNLGLLYASQGRYEAAEQRLRAALALSPGFANAEHSLSMQLLAQGRYEEGWPLFEGRRRRADIFIPSPELAFPEWRGEDLSGKRLLVIGEQGFGDQIQFARFVRDAPAASVVYFCAPALAGLFRRAGLNALEAYRETPFPQADYWVLVGSLPLRLGVTLDSIPPPLHLGPPHVGGEGIGVVAQGRPTHFNDSERSLRGRDAELLLSAGRDLSPEATGANDFAETAVVVAGLDRVVTVDTAVAHLAASMGVPTHILLPASNPDWRWLRGREDSPWYPSVRLHRQAQPGDWRSVILGALGTNVQP